MTEQLALPIPEIEPRIQLNAARRLARMVRETRESYEIRRFRERRAAAKLGLARKVTA